MLRKDLSEILTRMRLRDGKAGCADSRPMDNMVYKTRSYICCCRHDYSFLGLRIAMEILTKGSDDVPWS